MTSLSSDDVFWHYTYYDLPLSLRGTYSKFILQILFILRILILTSFITPGNLKAYFIICFAYQSLQFVNIYVYNNYF